MGKKSKVKPTEEQPNYRRANTCEYCANLECKQRKPDMICDAFVEGGLVRVIPGFIPMSPRDWEILSG
jgi:hypothetical protein